MDWDQLFATTSDLLDVASSCWLNERREEIAYQSNDRDRQAARARRRADLAALSTKMGRIAEVDARIVLLEVAQGFPEQERFLLQLRALRQRLLAP